MPLGIRPTVDFAFKKTLWEAASAGHHRFRLVDTENHLELENTLEIHVLELPKYNMQEVELATASEVERWLYWMRHAHEHDAVTLRSLFPEEAFQQAITVIETIAEKTEDKQMYDVREKAARDHQWLINGAREEGMEKGKLAGKLQMLQELLGIPVTDDAELLGSDVEQLKKLVQSHQERLRQRDA